jgi:hypothetical protein
MLPDDRSSGLTEESLLMAGSIKSRHDACRETAASSVATISPIETSDQAALSACPKERATAR